VKKVLKPQTDQRLGLNNSLFLEQLIGMKVDKSDFEKLVLQKASKVEFEDLSDSIATLNK